MKLIPHLIFCADHKLRLHFCLFIWDRVFSLCRLQTYCMADDFELLILLSLLPKCWDQGQIPCLDYVCGAGDQIQSCVHIRQALCFLSCIPSLKTTILNGWGKPFNTEQKNAFAWHLKNIEVSDNSILKCISVGQFTPSVSMLSMAASLLPSQGGLVAPGIMLLTDSEIITG